MSLIPSDWWLPPNYSKHGSDTDALFLFIFWLTLAVMVGVHLVLIFLLIKYRFKPSRKKAKFTHGNGRLEIIWTIIPIAILLGLAIASKRVWDDFRSSPDRYDPARTKILVIGEQFKWNIIYPGPDGKFGRYLIYPKPSDLTWPIGPDGKPRVFQNIAGPASLPHDQALIAINNFIAQADESIRMGKDFSDPDGRDDDYQSALSRTLYVPVNRPVEIQVASRDVIHDFYVPNFRAQLYAVPGVIGSFVITPTVTTKEIETAGRRTYSVEELPGLLNQPAYQSLTIDIDEKSPGATKDKFGWCYVDSASAAIIRDGKPIISSVPNKLAAAGIRQIVAHLPGYLDVACAQLCGLGHYTMQSQLVVLSQEDFDKQFPAVPHIPATAMVQP